MRRRRWVTGVACLAAALIAGVLWATPASAHSQLLHTDPVDGATLTKPISEVDLTYNERVQGTFTTVVVNGPGGVSYSDGHVQVIDDVVHQKLYPLRSGTYTVAWRAISADGHPVEGQFHFTVVLPASQEPTAGPPRPGQAAPPASHTGAWVAVGVAALLVVGLIGLLALRPRRRGRDIGGTGAPRPSERTDSDDMADA